MAAFEEWKAAESVLADYIEQYRRGTMLEGADQDRVTELMRIANDERARVEAEGRLYFDMDGTEHYFGDCCQKRRCWRCGKVQHFQGIYGGYLEMCEFCDAVELAKFQPTS